MSGLYVVGARHEAPPTAWAAVDRCFDVDIYTA